ncbi:hypothetical protein [Amycolatopsis jiangsuensis]|uniref:Excreted virulence factor EspC (Type VII ESX diderm) n=1 Tax=Amycolatopsis jiangsuensis TaxID=1181879 RepID=A0A840IU75_9PSEU|nr:hypothetical protein [Amycolatopsis jiangsuensis]MBB4685343.1 hypothetical protein [Amycolatopsis jiangsuensis]
MTGGFGTVPEELADAANSIGDAVGRVGEMPWPGPSGDYGHAGVQQGWQTYLEDAESVVDRLIEKAREHGDALRRAASWYTLGDEQAGDEIGTFGARALDALGLDGGAKIGAGLSGVPGGGFTGGLTPSQLDERLGRPAPGGWTGAATGRISGSIEDDPAGVLNPRRSRELFPGAAGGAGDSADPGDFGDPSGEGPVF